MLRRPRYLGLIGISLVVAIVCIGLGTWQIDRFKEKRSANHELLTNNKDKVANVTSVLGPAADPVSNGKAQEFRHVTATGTYLGQHEVLVRGQTVSSTVGYLVLTPLKTSGGVLLVVRGFVEQTSAAAMTPKVPAAPGGTVTVTARLEPASTRTDHLGRLPNNQVESINPTDQAARLGEPVWNGYAELLAGQPGGAGLTTIPDPDLSNPAGGADEPQHAAYVLQWYLFAGLALAAPLVLASAEQRHQQAADDPDPNTGTGAPAQPPADQGSPAAAAAVAGDRSEARPSVRESRRARKAALDDRLAGKS